MATDLFPTFINEHYEVHEWKHACAILHQDFLAEGADIIAVLTQCRLKRSQLVKGGGSKSEVSKSTDGFLYARDWRERQFATKIVVDGVEIDSPTHKVDCFKNRVALEIEWNNKDAFYDRDLNNFWLQGQRGQV